MPPTIQKTIEERIKSGVETKSAIFHMFENGDGKKEMESLINLLIVIFEQEILQALTSQSQMMVDIVEGKKHKNLQAMETGSEFMTPRMYRALGHNSALTDILTSYKESGLIK